MGGWASWPCQPGSMGERGRGGSPQTTCHQKLKAKRGERFVWGGEGLSKKTTFNNYSQITGCGECKQQKIEPIVKGGGVGRRLEGYTVL